MSETSLESPTETESESESLQADEDSHSREIVEDGHILNMNDYNAITTHVINGSVIDYTRLLASHAFYSINDQLNWPIRLQHFGTRCINSGLDLNGSGRVGVEFDKIDSGNEEGSGSELVDSGDGGFDVIDKHEMLDKLDPILSLLTAETSDDELLLQLFKQGIVSDTVLYNTRKRFRTLSKSK